MSTVHDDILLKYDKTVHFYRQNQTSHHVLPNNRPTIDHTRYANAVLKIYHPGGGSTHNLLNMRSTSVTTLCGGTIQDICNGSRPEEHTEKKTLR